ncbi:MAG TPA: ATP synthase F1 subunit epsilon [bacterium]|nr:ATP synthase F1 subunit epsilon [bacterium]
MFDLEIISPLAVLYSAKVRHVVVPGVEGYLGILAGHEPFVTTLTTGEIKIDLDNNQTQYFATSGGILEVLPAKTTILVETAEEASKINVERAIYAKERAQRRLADKQLQIDVDRAKIALAKAINRIKVSKKVC